MNRKVKSLTLSLILIAGYLALFDSVIELVAPVQGTTLYVNTTGSNGAYPHIQWAIDNASDGDTVYVYSGVYYENVIINKTISLIGENRNTTVIDGNGVGYVVRLMNADSINVSNFGIRNGETGIRIDSGTSYTNISWNHVHDIFSINDVSGISGNIQNTFYQNTVYNVSTNGSFMSANGIGVSLSSNVFYNTVKNISSNSGSARGIVVGTLCNISHNIVNNITSSADNHYSIGIWIFSSNNNVTHNYISNISSNKNDNYAIGIYLFFSSGNNVLNNMISSIYSMNYGSTGIFLEDSSNNYIYNNHIFNLSSFGSFGFELTSSNDNRFVSNHIYNISSFANGFGIYIINSLRCIFKSNSIHSIMAFDDAIGVLSGTSSSENWDISSNWIHDIVSLNDYPAAGIHADARYTNIENNTIFNLTSPYGRAYGIRVKGGRECNVTSNNVYNIHSLYSIANGICLEWPADQNNITNNLIQNISSGLKANGIHLNWSSDYNNFISNRINNISSPTGNANGMDFRDASHNVFENCSINNTKIGLRFDGQSLDNYFINCSVSNAGIYDLYFDDIYGGDSHAVALNTTFNKSKVHYEDTLSNLTVKWFMHVRVIYLNGTPAVNAYVWVNDSNGAPVFEGQADGNGWVRWLTVTEYIEQDSNGDHAGERTYFTPHDVTATDGELWGYTYPAMDISKVVTVILGLPTLLPPTNLTTKVVENGTSVELEWDPPPSPNLDHYLIYRADSAAEFNFTVPYNSSATWPNPLKTTWIDPDPNITVLNDDFYYIVRAANADESDISMTSNTAGVWTRTFHAGASTFSLPLEPFVKSNVEFYCQDMNASYIKWMNATTHTWMKHEKGSPENITFLEIGKGYEIGFAEETRYTFTGMPGAMIRYDDVPFGFDASPLAGDANSLTASADASGTVTLSWLQPANMGSEDGYYVVRSNKRDGFWGDIGVNYTILSILPFDILSYQDVGNATAGSEYYYMIVPVNLSTGDLGSSSYSIGVHTVEYLDGFDTFAPPLRPNSLKTADWYCDNINNTVGINYFNESNQRWEWHSKRMPADAFDPIIKIGFGYQLSTTTGTYYSFIGV